LRHVEATFGPLRVERSLAKLIYGQRVENRSRPGDKLRINSDDVSSIDYLPKALGRHHRHRAWHVDVDEPFGDCRARQINRLP
jgi:hypothetical protein